MFELELFRKQMYYIEESAWDIFGLYGDPVIRRPASCTSLLRPWYAVLLHSHVMFFVRTIQGISHLHDFMGV